MNGKKIQYKSRKIYSLMDSEISGMGRFLCFRVFFSHVLCSSVCFCHRFPNVLCILYIYIYTYINDKCFRIRIAITLTILVRWSIVTENHISLTFSRSHSRICVVALFVSSQPPMVCKMYIWSIFASLLLSKLVNFH